MWHEKKSELLGSSDFFVYLCCREWEGPAPAEKRYAPNLRSGNLGNFQLQELK